MNEALSGGQALLYAVKVLGGFYIFLVMMRFLLQLVYADFYNPISQFMVKSTQPLLAPLRRLLPSKGRLDFASLVLAVGLQTGLILIMLVLIFDSSVLGDFALSAVLWSIVLLGKLAVKIFYFSLIISVILSWIAPVSRHPAAELINQVVDPMLGIFRRFLPNLGGLDISPIFAIIGLNLLDNFVLMNLAQAVNMPSILLGSF
ncbi:hypothetical protein AKN93_03655 [Thiopseudomonas alkaliphila]|uniref:YggT family protein n=1 Tax=Thiopseudomonas alkaliphila TaxID=1697053 RepID=UPI00069DB99E|nr:YggT family protein [Thiopseudomonas alkaliphila]AKX47183.1 hypothetical protein AKN94_07285 [Thiopseudomonas alkaliphila]AKX48593.1 hypothetical protein AKN93_03655 [Thiopseudomonas alkaliphila]